VSPHGRTSTADSSFSEANADHFQMMKRRAKALLGQSEFQDWITAVDMNEQIALMDARANELAEKLRSGEIKSGSLKRTVDGLLKGLFTQPTRTGTHLSFCATFKVCATLHPRLFDPSLGQNLPNSRPPLKNQVHIYFAPAEGFMGIPKTSALEAARLDSHRIVACTYLFGTIKILPNADLHTEDHR
jgi:hypothetical protein